MAREEKESLKDTDPIKYLKNKKASLVVIKLICIIAPILVCLVAFAIDSGITKPDDTNWVKFSIGVVLAVIFLVFVAFRESHKSKNIDREERLIPIDLSSFLAWLVVGVILYLVYITTLYMVILCFAEAVGQFGASICAFYIHKYAEEIKITNQAEITKKTADRIDRQTEQKVKDNKWRPID